MIRQVDSDNLKEAIYLVNKVFAEFVAPGYSQQGRETFENYLKIKDEDLTRDMESGHKKMWACYRDDQIVGVISVRDNAHISLLFVDKRFHRQGIAKELLAVALADMRTRSNAGQVTVNSSPYAVEAYERLGFTRTGEQREKDGIVFTPMVRPL